MHACKQQARLDGAAASYLAHYNFLRKNSCSCMAMPSCLLPPKIHSPPLNSSSPHRSQTDQFCQGTRPSLHRQAPSDYRRRSRNSTRRAPKRSHPPQGIPEGLHSWLPGLVTHWVNREWVGKSIALAGPHTQERKNSLVSHRSLRCGAELGHRECADSILV